MQNKMKEFLRDDLKKLEYHIQEIINYMYARGEHKEYKENVEQIEGILIYWNNHINKL